MNMLTIKTVTNVTFKMLTCEMNVFIVLIKYLFNKAANKQENTNILYVNTPR